jgi:hypothetical protein
MRKQVKICLGIFVLLAGILTISGCNYHSGLSQSEVLGQKEFSSDQKEFLSIEEIKSQCEEVKVSLGEREYGLVKTKPELVEYWYQYLTSVDDREWTLDGENSYVCLSFAFDSAEQWKKDFSNQGLYLAESRKAFHEFNAVYLGGLPLDIESWCFLEPQWGKIIKVGGNVWSFPVGITLEYEGVFYEGEFSGINPELKIIWQTGSKTGTLFGVDRAGNLIPE